MQSAYQTTETSVNKIIKIVGIAGDATSCRKPEPSRVGPQLNRETGGELGALGDWIPWSLR